MQESDYPGSTSKILMKSTWLKSQQRFSNLSPRDAQRVRSLRESGPLHWNWTSHPRSWGFPLVGVFWGPFFSAGWRGWCCCSFTGNVLTEDPSLSLSSWTCCCCCCCLRCVGFKPGHTPDGWGRTHPGFINKRTILSWQVLFVQNVGLNSGVFISLNCLMEVEEVF